MKKSLLNFIKCCLKAKKETDADQLIEAITSGNSVPKAKKQQPVMDFESLKSSINYFLECVDNDYYFAPNRIIHKAQRSKWRFEVKNYVKMLNGIPADGEHGEESAKLMRGLFQRLHIL